MSIVRCEECERMVDTDFEEMVDIGNMRRLEKWICQGCYKQIDDEIRDDEEAYHTSTSPAEEYERVERMRRDMEKAMGPDHTKTGIFIYNRCAYCDDGRLPCRQGAVNRCDNPRARND